MTNEPLKATHTPLPCPFCGSDEISHGIEFRYPDDIAHVQCHECDAFITAPSEIEALTAWNTRAVNSHHDLIEALREAMSALAWIGDNCDDRAATRHADDAYDNIVEAFPGLNALLTKAEAGHG